MIAWASAKTVVSGLLLGKLSPTIRLGVTSDRKLRERAVGDNWGADRDVRYTLLKVQHGDCTEWLGGGSALRVYYNGYLRIGKQVEELEVLL